MYQEDMVNEGDGCGGMLIHSKVSIQSSASAQSIIIVGRGSLEDVPDDELDDPEPLPYNGSELSSDEVQGQYHEYPGQQRLPLPPKGRYSTEHIERLSRARSQSTSPQRFQASVERTNSRDKRSIVPTRQSSQDNYVLMSTSNMEIEQPKHDNKRRRRHKADTTNDIDDQYVANVALSIQCAMVFFCVLILVAIIMSIFSIRGYVVIVVVCLVILISLLIGLCTFVHQVLNEDDSPRVNSKHMPRWYKTLTKIIKDEIADFQEDWKNMYNGMYLLEGGDAGDSPNDNNSNEGNGNSKDKSKKNRKGKSAVFKMIAKPAAVFANFRRKRKEKKKQKKAEKAAAESYFPPIV